MTQNKKEEINQLLTQQFQKNMFFLENNFPDLHKKINNLSNNQNKYFLEFINNEYFDIYNEEKNEFLYNYNTFIEANKRTENIDFSSSHTINLLRQNPFNKKFIAPSIIGETKSLVDFLNLNLSFENITYKKIYKHVYIGVGVGIHINEIDKKIQSMNTLIIEPSIEIFKLSLFLLDYSIFTQGNRSLFLAINDSDTERRIIYEEFKNHHFYMNHTIKYHLLNTKCKNILDELISFFRQTPLEFPYNKIIQVYERTISFMKKNYKFVKKDLLLDNLPFQNKRVLVIAAGPSVDNHISFIKKNQGKFIIICVDKIIQKMEKEGIVPDIVLSIDPDEKIKDFFQLKNINFLKNSALIFLSQQEDELLEIIKELNFYFIQVLQVSKDINLSMSIPNVGLFSMLISLLLGSKEVYMTGIDAAFDTDSGKTYANNTIHKMIKDLDNNIQIKNNNNVSDDDTIEIKGNFQEKVKTNYLLIHFKYDFEKYLNIYKKTISDNFEIYNLSEGAYIEGFIPKKIGDLNCKNFKNKNFNPVQALEKISIKVKDIKFEKDNNLLIEIINYLRSFKKKTKVNNDDEFQAKKLELMTWILEKLKTFSNEGYGIIFLEYSSLIDTYINYAINLEHHLNSDDIFLNDLLTVWTDVTIKLFEELKDIINE